MTNLEALGASVNYPLANDKLEKILVDNGIKSADEYEGATKAFELATASLYVLLVTSANIVEGDYQVSATDKSNFMKLAAGIFNKHGVDNPLLANKIRNRSYYW